jgi:hypothetical protein
MLSLPYACLLFFRGGFSSKLAELPLEGSYDASVAFPSSMFGPTPFSVLNVMGKQ